MARSAREARTDGTLGSRVPHDVHHQLDDSLSRQRSRDRDRSLRRLCSRAITRHEDTLRGILVQALRSDVEIYARRERERRKDERKAKAMSYLGEYQPWTDTWIYTCAGCGREFQVPDSISPLDGLGCCSAECDAIVEVEFERRLAADPERRAQLEREGWLR